MTKVFIIHGIYGHPGENWFPWLKSELEKLGCEVFVPAFPTPENHSFGSWMEVFSNYDVGEDSILVGHSVGATFTIRFLEKKRARAAFLVAGVTKPINNKEVDALNASFYGPVDWESVKANCGRFFVYNSDNDPYVSLETGKELARELGVELNVVEGAGHFNEAAGYTKFSLLLEDIKALLGNSEEALNNEKT